MGEKLAIDLGTTNTVVARWDSPSASAQVLRLPGISLPSHDPRPPLVPSVLYVHDGQSGRVSMGQAAYEGQWTLQKDNRLFRNFKRGIVAAPSPEPRLIDDRIWGDREAGQSFVRGLVNVLPYRKSDIEQLVLSAPVIAFEGYLAWLSTVIPDLADEQIRIVDELTAAALGYGVTEAGAIVLVFDFGGGSLDLSLVQLPERRESTGGMLRKLLRASPGQHTARVIAKAGRIIGGSDVDQWLLADVLACSGLDAAALGDGYGPG